MSSGKEIADPGVDVFAARLATDSGCTGRGCTLAFVRSPEPRQRYMASYLTHKAVNGKADAYPVPLQAMPTNAAEAFGVWVAGLHVANDQEAADIPPLSFVETIAAKARAYGWTQAQAAAMLRKVTDLLDPAAAVTAPGSPMDASVFLSELRLLARCTDVCNLRIGLRDNGSEYVIDHDTDWQTWFHVECLDPPTLRHTACLIRYRHRDLAKRARGEL